VAKCILKNDIPLRVSDDEASRLVRNEGWEYIPKSRYKRLRVQKSMPEEVEKSAVQNSRVNTAPEENHG
jgi:hypothetical protein